MATLEARLVAYDALLAYEIEVLVELAHLNIADAAGHIDLAVVEEHAGVVVDARELAFLPAPPGISGREEPSARVVAVDEEVELTVVILHRASPHAGGVSVLVVHEVVAVGRGELCERLSAVVPVDQVGALEDCGSREMVHGCRYHVIGIAHAYDIGVGEVGEDDGILVAPALVADRDVLEVGVGPVLVVVVGIPVHAGLAARLLQTVEGWHDLVFVDERVDINQASRAREGHRDIAVVVEQCLEGLAPLRRGTGGPGAPVGLHPFTVLVVVACALFLRAPVDLSDDDGGCVDHRHLLAELVDLVRRVGSGVAAAVPSTVVVDGVAYVGSLDGEGGIVGVVSLPACAGGPYDSREAIAANLIDDGLEVVVQGLGVVAPLSVLERHGFVGQFNTYLSGIFLDIVVLSEDVPDFQEVLLIVVAHLQLAGTYAWRAHDYIHAVVHGALHQREIERSKIGAQACLAEM